MFKPGDIVVYVGDEEIEVHPFFYGNKYKVEAIASGSRHGYFMFRMSDFKVFDTEIVSLEVFNSPLYHAMKELDTDLEVC
jgi:hypothetical protein